MRLTAQCRFMRSSPENGAPRPLPAKHRNQSAINDAPAASGHRRRGLMFRCWELSSRVSEWHRKRKGVLAPIPFLYYGAYNPNQGEYIWVRLTCPKCSLF